MNDLQFNNATVSDINNTSNFTNTQNSTLNNPIQNQKDNINQTYQQFLKAQEWGNNLTQENSTEITPNSNQHKKKK